jgi:hypothetical protein
MTEIEVAEKIVRQRSCAEVGCSDCPAQGIKHGLDSCVDVTGFSFGINPEEKTQWFKDFLKGAKGMNGIDKAEAKKRLDVIEAEARKLREIIEKGDRIEYDPDKIYVAIKEDGTPYIMAGREEARAFAFHAFISGCHASEFSFTSSRPTAQDCIDYHKDKGLDIHVFTDTRKAFEFFLEHYKG